MRMTNMNDTMGLSKDSMRWLLGAVAVLVVLVAGWWFTSKGAVKSPVVSDNESEEVTMNEGEGISLGAGGASTDRETTASSGETVSAEDQAAGASAMISASLKKISWLAVMDKDLRILGAGRFVEGDVTGKVELLRATKAGETYFAVIFVDDGDKAFDLHKDMLVTTADGSVLGSEFKAE